MSQIEARVSWLLHERTGPQRAAASEEVQSCGLFVPGRLILYPSFGSPGQDNI